MRSKCGNCGALLMAVSVVCVVCNYLTPPNSCAPTAAFEYCGAPFMRPNDDDEPAGRIFYNDGPVSTMLQAASGGGGGISVPRFNGAINGHPMNTVATNGTFYVREDPRPKNES